MSTENHLTLDEYDARPELKAAYERIEGLTAENERLRAAIAPIREYVTNEETAWFEFSHAGLACVQVPTHFIKDLIAAAEALAAVTGKEGKK